MDKIKEFTGNQLSNFYERPVIVGDKTYAENYDFPIVERSRSSGSKETTSNTDPVTRDRQADLEAFMKKIREGYAAAANEALRCMHSNARASLTRLQYGLGKVNNSIKIDM